MNFESDIENLATDLRATGTKYNLPYLKTIILVNGNQLFKLIWIQDEDKVRVIPSKLETELAYDIEFADDIAFNG